jgi:hypothetical protein
MKRRPGTESGPVRRFLRGNGLTIFMLALFFGALVPMSIAGMLTENAERREHGEPPLSFGRYLASGPFIEGVFENWESEFLQMGVYVLATVFFFQVGSPESKRLEEREPQDVDPKLQRYPDSPKPVRRGGIWLGLYANSLSIALFALFLASMVLHAVGGAGAFNDEQLSHGGETVSILRYATTSRFWFESFQNWQSEFLAVAALVVLSIWLRQQGSPESKPVAAPHRETGT